MINSAQKARMQAKINKLKTPSYFELKSNRTYWIKHSPKRQNLKRLVNNTVPYIGHIMAIRQYNSDKHYCVHILLKPVMVAHVATDHLWINVPLHKFNRIYKNLYPEFNSKTMHVNHITITTNTPIFVTGKGKLVLYTRKAKKLRDIFNEEYGFREIDSIRVLNNQEIRNLPVQFKKTKDKRINSKQFKYSQQLFNQRIKLNLSVDEFSKKLNIDPNSYLNLEHAFDPDLKNYQKVLLKLNAEKSILKWLNYIKIIN